MENYHSRSQVVVQLRDFFEDSDGFQSEESLEEANQICNEFHVPREKRPGVISFAIYEVQKTEIRERNEEIERKLLKSFRLDDFAQET